MISDNIEFPGQQWQKRKPIQVFIHKALVQHHTAWVNCSQKVKWSVIPDVVTEQNDKSKKLTTKKRNIRLSFWEK